MLVSALIGFLSLAGYILSLAMAVLKPSSQGSGDDRCIQDHGPDRLAEIIDLAFRSCKKQSFMVIAARSSKHFVQFRKDQLESGATGLTLWFPEAAWSATYLRKLRHLLLANDIEFWESRDQVFRFIHVDCGGDVSSAFSLVHLCFYRVFGLSPQTRFNSRVFAPLKPSVQSSVTAGGTSSAPKFDSNGRATCPEEDEWHDGVPFLDRVVLIFWLLCFPSLWLSFYLNLDAVGEWYVDVSSLRLAGNYSTLILLLLFCSLFATLCWLTHKENPKGELSDLSWFELTCYCLAFFGLPLAVVLSWIGW